MKISFSQYLYNLNGEVFTEDGNKPITFETICARALETPYQDEQGSLTGEQKYMRFELMAKIKGALELALSMNEIAELKHVIGKLWGVAVVGASYDILNGKDRGTGNKIAALPGARTGEIIEQEQPVVTPVKGQDQAAPAKARTRRRNTDPVSSNG